MRCQTGGREEVAELLVVVVGAPLSPPPPPLAPPLVLLRNALCWIPESGAHVGPIAEEVAPMLFHPPAGEDCAARAAHWRSAGSMRLMVSVSATARDARRSGACCASSRDLGAMLSRTRMVS